MRSSETTPADPGSRPGLATLVVDLEKNKLLDRTLIVVATEFGRPPEFDAGGGSRPSLQSLQHCAGWRGIEGLGRPSVLPMNWVKLLSIVQSRCQIFTPPSTAHSARSGEAIVRRGSPVPITDRGQPVRQLFA